MNPKSRLKNCIGTEKLQTQKPCIKESYIFIWDFGWKNKK
jgi:hypothetical protein